MFACGQFECLQTDQRHLAVVSGHGPSPRRSAPQLRPVERSIIYAEVQGIVGTDRLVVLDAKQKEILAGFRDAESVLNRILPGRAAQ